MIESINMRIRSFTVLDVEVTVDESEREREDVYETLFDVDSLCICLNWAV